ncbi:translation initiation factor IF-2 [Thermodesulfobacteriota bacterium]
MALLTVDDLARDLKVRNEDLVKQLVTMGFNVEGPESPLETDDPAALRAELVTALPKREIIEKRIKPTVIRRRVKRKTPVARAKAERSAPTEDEAAPEPITPVERDSVVPEKPTHKPKEGPKAATRRPKSGERAKIIEKAPLPPPIEPVQVTRPVEQPKVEPRPDATQPQTEPERPAPVEAKEAAPKPTKPEAGAPKAKAEDQTEKPVKEPPVPAETKANGDQVGARAKAAKPATRTIPEPRGPVPLSPRPGPTPLSDDKASKRKKKRDKKVTPAQIIGRVELKKEPPKEVRQPPRQRPPQRDSQPYSLGDFRRSAPPPPMESPDDRGRKKKKEKKARDAHDTPRQDDQGKVRRSKSVMLRDELYGDRHRHGRLRGRGKKNKQRKTAITTPKASKRRIKLPDLITVSNLAHKLSVKATEVIKHLLAMGQAASMNESLDFDTATLVSSEFGFETESAEHSEQDMLPDSIKDTDENLVARPPVVTMMGHVDHGKTSLLDHIRSTRVTAQEAGGITQHIGAYKVKTEKGEVVFLDTPGHEAFTAMRSRGAKVTDFVVLVVAADDGVMDQTEEAINHSRAAEVPIIVAVNKMDKPEADKARVIRELSERNLISEEWGGDTLFAFVSAKTGEGIDDLLELILLQAEIMELRANPNKAASATVVEARLDKGKGPVATVLLSEGTLKLGDAFVAGTHYGKIRSMVDHEGRSVLEAGPADPVEIQGLSGVPDAGDLVLSVIDEKLARQIVLHRQTKIREKETADSSSPISMDDLLAKMQEAETKELNLIVKGDVQGSVEALKESLVGTSTSEIGVKIIHSGVGAINESDVMLATASNAIIIGFNVRPAPGIAQLAEEKNVDLHLYTVIYEAIDDVRKAMEGLLEPVAKEVVVGNVEVRQIFTISRMGTIAGCHVTSGKIQRSNNVRLVRDGVVIYEGKLASLKRFKDDIKEALEGFECGIMLQNYNDIKVGDVIEAFVIEHEAAKLS